MGGGSPLLFECQTHDGTLVVKWRRYMYYMQKVLNASHINPM